MTKKIAIVGSAQSKSYAPWGDASWQIWSMNHRHYNYARTDRHFDLHSRHRSMSSNKEYLRWLKALGDKVFLAEEHPELSDARLYPQKIIMEKYGDFFTNSVSWMLALALHEGAGEIGIYGIDMAMKSEYEYQRPSVLYFIGLAKGMGVRVTLPPCEKLFRKDRLYWLL